MMETLMASWDNQEWPGDGAAGPGLRRPSTPQQGVELLTEMGQEAGAPWHPSQDPAAPKISGIIPLLPCVPTSQPGHWLLRWESWDPKEPAPREGTSLSHTLRTPSPLGKLFLARVWEQRVKEDNEGHEYSQVQ